MDPSKWHIRKLKSRWWLIKPKGWPMDFVAEHVGTFEECCNRFKEIGHGAT